MNRHSIWIGLWLIVAMATTGCGGGGGSSGAPPPPPPAPQTGVGPAQCVNGSAAGFPCNAVHLRKRVPLSLLGGAAGNDIWGWTDPQNGMEYALVGLSNGVAFVRLADPDNPVVVGHMATATTSSSWRDIKVAQNHAYVVADNAGNHGMQVFDLTRLRGAASGQSFLADTTYGDFAHAHNIAINEQTNFAYAVGTNTCAGGLHMIDISAPQNPVFAGCHAADGDTHDAQCVTYAGPDIEHRGKEICFDSNENHVAIVDVSTKSSTVRLSRFGYPNVGFVHQGWLSEDQRFLFVGDEFDEQQFRFNTRTLVFDVGDLDAPVFLYGHQASTTSVDHNMYVRGSRLYQANYSAGLRVLTFTNLMTDTLVTQGSFDTRPEDDSATFNGAWSVYPYFPSGVIVVSDIQRGLFVLSM